MKYIAEAELILKDVFFQNCVDDDDWKFFLIELEKQSGTTLESISNDIETGIENGYSIEQQIAFLKLILIR